MTSFLRPLSTLALLAALAPLSAQELSQDEATARDLADLLKALPPLPAVAVQTIDAPPAPGSPLAAGLSLAGRQVVLEGTVLIDRGPVDGLEVLACLKGGKNHEAMIGLDCDRADLVKAACIAALDLHDGVPAPEGGGQPARGTPVRVRLFWQANDPLSGSSWKMADASALVRDRLSDRAYPPLPYIYTGSQERTIPQTGPDGTVVQVRRFMLSDTRSVIVNFDEPDALLAAPYPLALQDNCFEVNTAALPPPAGSRVRLVLDACPLPLELAADAQGGLHHEGAVLDDAALAALLARHYGAAARPAVRAVGVRAGPDVPRSVDRSVRTRLLKAAAAAKAWVVPVFVLPPPAPAPATAPGG